MRFARRPMFFTIVASQARHKWGIALFVFLAMTSLVTLYVYSNNTATFSNRSMQLVMKNMGHNLLIVPTSADPRSIYLCTDDQTCFSDEITRRMSDSLDLSSRYYVSVLQSRVQIDDQEVLLTGIEPIARKDETQEKRNMILPLGESEARLGSECARKLRKKTGQSVRVLGKEFRIVEVLPSKAMVDDCRLYIDLARCQELLRKQGQINYILAFLCLHAGSLDRALELQEQRLAERFPGFRQISRMDIAQGRYLARSTTQKSLAYLLGIVAATTMIVIAVTGLQEVSDRRYETGIMIATGISYTYVICLYVVKTIVLALTAAVTGFFVGSMLAVYLTTPFTIVNTKPVAIVWEQLPFVIALTCAVAIVAELIPILKLVSLDPNTILAEQ